MPILKSAEAELPAPKQARSIEKRKKLMEAARLLFGEKGYQATSIGDITSRGGAAAGAFYQYFRSKKQLLVALMREFIEGLASLNLQPQQAADLQVGLRGFLAAAFRVDAAYFGVVRGWREAVLSDAELGRMQDEIERWTNSRVLGLFERLQKHPGARAGVDLAGFAQMMDRHIWSLLAAGSRMTSAQLESEVTLAADVIHHYLFRDPGPGAEKT